MMKIEPISLPLLLLSQAAVAAASIDAITPPLRGSTDSVVNLDDDVPDAFEPAISLEEFAALDSSTVKVGSYFEWVDSNEIEAGGTTCGFLHAPLRWPHAEVEADDSFPEVKVCKSWTLLNSLAH
ncbi:hypothetical protein THAOC_35280 [Thalassiosira oceanica]|uniref:Uncharacterized protein n=1 Tax=Thalassiosira oceanica TaxID=159749 RepID=K0RHG9_THAOC|nr:hypothetical protein THAOC_35280 [Thalassiosira oceanica]|eukprot:EJK46077.1 hypothetical protein THAOC_35280 [Thalassiosira oceanica]